MRVLKHPVFILVLVGLVLLCNGSNFFAPLHYQDEYKAVKIANPGLSFYGNYPSEDREAYNSLVGFVKHHCERGRFHVLTLCVQWMMAKGFGENAFPLRLLMFLLITGSVFLFFSILKKLDVSSGFSLLGAGLLLSGPYDEAWFRYTAELPGIFLLLASIYSLIRDIETKNLLWRITGLSFLLLAGLTKESFLALIPVIGLQHLVLTRWITKRSWRIALKESQATILSIAMVFAILSAGLLLTIKGAGGAYRSDAALSPTLLLPVNAISFLQPLWLWVPVILLAVVLLARRDTTSKMVWPAAVVTLVWIVAQFTVYKGMPVVSPVRYLLPALLPVTTLAAIALHRFYQMFSSAGMIAVVVIAAFYIGYQLKNVRIDTSYNTARLQAYHGLLDQVAVSDAEQIAILVETGVTYEIVHATAVFLSQRGKNAVIYYADVHPGRKKQSLQEQFERSLTRPNHGLEPELKELAWEDITDNNIDLVLLGLPVGQSKTDVALLGNHFPKEISSSATYFNLGLRSPTLTSTLTFRAYQQ